MSDTVDVAIIGAGPYGLSISAYFSSAGVEHRIFGHPMSPWRSQMPPGMQLKSHGWSSCLYDPEASFTLKRYCEEHGVPYHDSSVPVPLETFAAYGEEFQRRLVPGVERKTLLLLEYKDPHFRAVFDDMSEIMARRIVLAVGVHPFKHVPEQLAGLPTELLTHSGDHGQLDAFAGKEVIVLGSGASATDLAALLSEKGSEVSLVARSHELRFATSARTQKSLLRQLVQPLRELLSPGTGIGRGWALKLYADAPAFFHALPARRRHNIVETTLGPLGTSGMRERFEGRVPVHLGRSLEAARTTGGRIELQLRASDGSSERLTADHVVAATGYRIDLTRLPFIDSRLLSQIKVENGKPALSLDYETSVPGLHVVGPASAFSFGPVCRFVFGAVHPARTLSRVLADPRRSLARPQRLSMAK
jgi:thioredoxin reductase